VRLAAGAFDDGRRPTLSWYDNEIVAEHRCPPYPMTDRDAAHRGNITN
jgi:hypothetical protein